MPMKEESEFSGQKETWRRYASRSPGAVETWCEVRPLFATEFVKEMDDTIVGDSAC